MKRLEKDEALCTGCRQCEEACSKAFYKTADRTKSCIRITDREDGTHKISVCTRLDKKECAGCLMCVGFCPEDVMVQSDDCLEPSKCTACGICVKACPTGAIRLVEE